MIKSNFRLTTLLMILLLTALALSACGQPEPEVDIEAQRTGFAQTAEAQSTMTAQAQPTATETPLPTPTFTQTPNVTNTPRVTPTQREDTGGTDRAVLIDQNPDNNSTVNPGEPFAVTWTFENRGTSTWSTNYYIQYSSGEQMGAPDKVFVWLSVPPNTSLPLTVNFTVPTTAGTVVSSWRLFNAADTAFYDFSVTLEVSASD